jgi:hypothetical protein
VKPKIESSVYGKLLAIRRELIPIDVPHLCRLVYKTIEVEGQISGENILLFFLERPALERPPLLRLR